MLQKYTEVRVLSRTDVTMPVPLLRETVIMGSTYTLGYLHKGAHTPQPISSIPLIHPTLLTTPGAGDVS